MRPAGALPRPFDVNARARHFFLFDEVRRANFTEQPASRFAAPSHPGPLKTNLADAVFGVHRNERNPVLRYGRAGDVGDADILVLDHARRLGGGVPRGFVAAHPRAGLRGDDGFDAPGHVGHLVAQEVHALERRTFQNLARGGREVEQVAGGAGPHAALASDETWQTAATRFRVRVRRP